MKVINKFLKLLKLQTVSELPNWKKEDKRLPIWVRKEVAKYRQDHDVYGFTEVKKIFYGKHYVYKFYWSSSDHNGQSPLMKYEEWVKEKRRH